MGQERRERGRVSEERPGNRKRQGRRYLGGKGKRGVTGKERGGENGKGGRGDRKISGIEQRSLLAPGCDFNTLSNSQTYPTPREPLHSTARERLIKWH